MKIVVVGAGPAGATASYLLARSGHDVTLIERHESFDREFRGERLMPESQATLKQMGLWDLLAEAPQEPLTSTQVYLDRRPAYTISTVINGHSPLFMSQPAMLDRIVAAAAAFPGFRLMRSCSLESLVWKDERVTGVRVACDGNAMELPCDLAIACDGRGSLVRRLAALEEGVDLQSEAQDILWSKITPSRPVLARGTSRMFPGHGTMAFVLPAPDGSLQFGYSLPKGAYKELRSKWIDSLQQLLDPELATELEAHRKTVKPSLLNVIAFTLHRWTKPGLVVIGDAAHPMSPAGGQGIAMALADALSLAQCVDGREARSLEAVDAACEAWAAIRMAEVRNVQAAQKRLATLYLQNDLKSRLIVRYGAPLISRFAGKLMTAGIMGPKGLRRSTGIASSATAT